MPTLRQAESARNTSHVDVNQQLLIESAGGDSIFDIPLPNVPLPNVPLLNVPVPNVPLPVVHLRGAGPNGLLGEEWTSP